MLDIAATFRAKQMELQVMLLGGRSLIAHPGEKGAATEENWRRLLRSYLPARYQVASGCAVDVDGNVSEQIDVLLLDNQYTPVLFETGGVRYFPAESLYAAFEVKQDINKDHIGYAGDKVASVRRLRRTSAPIQHAGGTHAPGPPKHIIGGLLATESGWSAGLGQRFEESLLSLDADSALDIGCAVRHGAFRIDVETGSPVITKSPRDLSLIFFTLSLLDMLQAIGTVAAIDYHEWLKHAR